MKLITEIKLKPNHLNQELLKEVAKKAKISENLIKNYEIIKFGIDARKKPNVYFVYNVAIDVDKKHLQKLKCFEDVYPDHDGLVFEKAKSNKRPVVVGFGPSGMFCALALAMAGLNPIVLEQGKDVESRQKDVLKFWQNGELNEFSNVQFGEGGAGTFSDGKLNTTLNNPYCKKVINEFILNGAPKEIYFKNKAHIGTDNLREIVKNIREKVIKHGGKVVFNAKMTNFDVQNAQITSVQYLDVETNKTHNLQTNCLVLAIGHSDFGTFKLLNKKSVQMHKKPFAMGVRIELPQKVVNMAQYGADDVFLPSADFKLVEHLPGGRSVFTFCMCPGGKVVASSCEKGTIVTNGMSNFARNERFANSALLVNVTPDDFSGENILEGFELQRKYEKLAFEIAGSNYCAPAQKVGSFLKEDKNFGFCSILKNNKNFAKNKLKLTKNVKNLQKIFKNQVFCGDFSYKPGLFFCDISSCLPKFVVDGLKQALPLFNKKIKGFANKNNILIAAETKSSCPVWIDRSENYVCTFNGLYAIGEGSGFAGGIVSSAVDGIKCAEKIINDN